MATPAPAWIKPVVLILITLQTSSYVILLSISKSKLHENYSATEVVVCSEILKLVVSGLISYYEKTNVRGLFGGIRWFAQLLVRGKQLVVLVILYSFSNTIPYFAMARIGAPVFTVVMQLKIMFTAGFATVMLSRKYSPTKWRALVLLVIGCILVSSPIINKSSTNRKLLNVITLENDSTTGFDGAETVLPFLGAVNEFGSEGRGLRGQVTENSGDNAKGGIMNSALVGLCATLIQAVISGFSSVYFEGILKSKDAGDTIWDRNFQLAFYSIAVLIIFITAERIRTVSDSSMGSGVSDVPLFEGWSYITVLIVILNGAGGLLVAATLKYADAVLKCFATAVSILVTSAVSYFVLDTQVDLFVALGYIVTVLSIFNYSFDATVTTT